MSSMIPVIVVVLVIYFAAMVVGLLLITYVPAFSLWLPSMFGMI